MSFGKNSACYTCVAPKRHIGCHDHCDDYKALRAQVDAARAAKNREIAVDTYVIDETRKSMKRRLR